MRIGFIGAGNMAFALASSILNKSNYKDIIMSDKKKERLATIKRELRINITTDNSDVVNKSDIVFIAVKPQDMPEVLEEIKSSAKEQLFVSIAAGVTLTYLQTKLVGKRIIRVMPNIGALVGEACAGYSLGINATKKDGEIIKKILSLSGKLILLSEESLDVITALSGSGIGFIASFLEGMVAGGIKNGLSKEEALLIVEQTAHGTIKLLLEKKITPNELIRIVSSKGGTTEAGLTIFESLKLKEIIISAIDKSIERSKKLSGMND